MALMNFRKKQLLAEEKNKNSGTLNIDDSKAYGSEPASRAVLSYCTLEQGFQNHMVSLCVESTEATALPS